MKKKAWRKTCENNGEGISVKQRGSSMAPYGISRSGKAAKMAWRQEWHENNQRRNGERRNQAVS
jgi:hypothetical protein